MNGTLAAHPLAELIREIASKSLSGALRLEQDRVRIVVYFENGDVVFAASNIRTLRLREYLKARGLVSEEEFAALKNPGADLRLGESLVASGKLQPKDFDSLMATLVSDILRVPLLWTEGTWELDERARLADAVRATVDASSLLKEAAHRLPLKFVSLRFRNPHETFTRSTDGSDHKSLLAAESFVLSRLEQPSALTDVVSVSGLAELDAFRVLYGLALSGFIQREFWQNAFRTEGVKPGATPTPVASGTSPEAATDRWAPVQEADPEVSLGPFLERLRAANTLYEVLDVSPKAGSNEIKNTYYSLARNYHPDRFHLKSGTGLHDQIGAAFARITQAYETLMDGKARTAYDASLAKKGLLAVEVPQSSTIDARDSGPLGNTPTDALEQAETYFQEGFELLQRGQVNPAVARFAAASRTVPSQAKYRAYYGRALAANEQTRRLAESEIQTAVKMDPSNANYRAMLAELYFELKFQKRAQSELDKALEIDPKNASALALLRKLESLRKV